MNLKIDPSEKRIVAIALVVIAAALGLIAFAAIKLGISVPTCVTSVKPFESGSFVKIADKRYEIHIVAKMWSFEPSKIVLPVGSVADIYLTSKDVTHGFNINGTNVNLMAIPFVVNYAQVKFDHSGSYPVVCHEYCGAGHQAMNGVIEVSDSIQDGYAEGITGVSQSSQPGGSSAVPSADSYAGRRVLETKGCVACHSLDGKPGVGPTFKGVWGRNEEFIDGSSQVVDAAYIKESILDPPKRIVKGFGPVMPKLPITDPEIDQVIEFVKTLK